jgi:hypothetical protein
MRTSRAKIGKLPEAIAWAKEIAVLAEKKSDVGKVAVYVDAFGELGTIRWVVDLSDWSQLEKVTVQLMGDPDYREKLSNAGTFFMEGMTNDVLMRAV